MKAIICIANCPDDSSYNQLQIIPDSVTTIGDAAFYGCDSLSSVVIPDSVTTIGDGAFNHCDSLSSVVIGNSVTTIGDGAFNDCDSLSSVTIGNSVTTIGNFAFHDCSSLSSVVIPDSVTTIGDYAFRDCDSLSSVKFRGDAPKFGSYVFDYVTATAYYPANNPTWTANVMQDYGGNITWIPYDPNHTHEYEANVTTPTCTEQGFITYICSCGDNYTSDETDALGHDMGRWEVSTAPTCTESGTETSICSRCDYSETRTIVATGHNYKAVVTNPTCTEKGFVIYTCDCGNSYVDDYVNALGHDYVEGICTCCGEEDPDYSKPVDNPFNDVAAGTFYYEPVLWAVKNGVTSGTSETTFDPSGLCLRAHVVTFLYRSAGSPVPGLTSNPFIDVKFGDFFYKPVLWAVENSITQGISENQFGSIQVCNRAAVVTFLWRAAGEPEPESTENPFVDVKTTDFFYKPVLWAIEEGITNGVDATHFGPGTDCNRAQVVTFLYRAYN